MMSDEISKKDQAFLLQFLQDKGFSVGPEDLDVLHGDGSDRRFYRVNIPRKMVAVFPSPVHPQRKEEARATYTIGCHLHDLGIATPEVIGHERDSGLVLLEDVGDVHLQSRIRAGSSKEEKIDLYFKAVDALLAFQVDGVVGFDTRCCWDTQRYDYDLMITRESDYFLQALCKDYAGHGFAESAVRQECAAIALRASKEPADFLLHRDYQSRNLMVQDGEIRIIDFQSARLGPLGYDLASLLFDPYVQLSQSERETIYNYYVTQASRRVQFAGDGFNEGYLFLAVQRVMQMLGAFAFLTQQKGKVFFEPFILPSLRNLHDLLKQLENRFPLLATLAQDVYEDIKESQRCSLSHVELN
ncbi:MAG: phosphotransferase [Desulfobulbaceae bacterium]|jgi:aminoglycoside/choline kinase family phosphotransferase|nr:phosphotransferase [Desulfobulbaceae bacterium]